MAELSNPPTHKSKPLCILIVGPTGVGKSRLALELALHFGGEIINCDSVQVYQGIHLGSAKPSSEDMKLVPHHLYDFVPLGGHFTAGDYHKSVNQVLHQRQVATSEKKSNLFFIVGGSGFYARTLEGGLYSIGKISSQTSRRLEDEALRIGWKNLYEELHRVDPTSAKKLSPQDHYRLGRALMVFWETGRPLSEFQTEFNDRSSKEDRDSTLPYVLKKIGLRMNRTELREVVHKRTLEMLKRGWIEEVRELLIRGYGDWPPLLSVGFKEVQAHLRGDLTQEQLPMEITQSTLQLAKKQMTWFKRDPSISWFEAPYNFSEISKHLTRIQDEFLH